MSTGDTFRRGPEGWPLGAFICLFRSACSETKEPACLPSAPLTRSSLWREFPGGSALAGETSQDAASRELREESWLDVVPSTLKLIDRFVEDSALLDFYVARVPSNAEVVPQQSEGIASEWVTPEEVIRRLDANIMADP
ncbi:NUDIX domain-containing protein [Arthrobacter sp. TMT4-20]